MKDDSAPDVINEALVCDGYEFMDHNTRARYIGTDLAKRPQFLKDHTAKWRKVAEVREKIAERRRSADSIVKVDEGTSSSRSNASDSEDRVAKAAAEPPLQTTPSPNATSPATETSTSVELLLQTIVENAVTINGRTYITTEQIALMLDVSVRTLYRLFENGNGPSKIKIPGTFYELDEALQWMTDRKRAIKRHH
jgi:predicted DNA-binding transcriptional regulator AlpA